MTPKQKWYIEHREEALRKQREKREFYKQFKEWRALYRTVKQIYNLEITQKTYEEKLRLVDKRLYHFRALKLEQEKLWKKKIGEIRPKK